MKLKDAPICRSGRKSPPSPKPPSALRGNIGANSLNINLYIGLKTLNYWAKVSATTEPKGNSSVSPMKATPARFGRWLQVLAELAEQLLTRSTITSKHSWMTPDSAGRQLVWLRSTTERIKDGAEGLWWASLETLFSSSLPRGRDKVRRSLRC